MENVAALRRRLAEIGCLHRAAAVLDWDLQTYMPPGGAQARAEQLGLLGRLAHERFIDAETGRLLERAEAESQGLDPDSDVARLLHNARRDYDRAVKIPSQLAGEINHHSALAQDIWAKARAASDFSAFAPSLEKMLTLVRQVAAHLGYADDPYDPLLDQHEPGMKTATVAAIFADLKPRLIALIQAIADAPKRAEEAPLEGDFPVDVQNALTLRIVQILGYDLQRGRQDKAAHPFCTTFSRGDVRITTRFDARHLERALYASLHEAGHALYEQGMPAEHENTPLDGGASMGLHESQSRMWENLVGRSRPFCAFVLPLLREAFPGPLAGCTVERFYRAVNRVAPSLIRVEADEVTYNLHVLLRFELERDLLAERLKVSDLPEAWNEKMRAYLGLTPPDDARGVLQDVHWAAGLFGYFPTYTLGNLMAGQLWRAIRQAIPDLDAQIERGEFAALLGWLREKVHRFGRKYRPEELMVKATGEPLTTRDYMAYLEDKYSRLYDRA